jgi:hypothetical protein
MKRWLLGSAAIVLVILATGPAWRTATFGADANPPTTAKVRIGVYDPRAVAIVYANSAPFKQKLRAKHQELDAAKAANDQAKIKELEAWGADQQVRLHLQGFAAAPVDDLMADVKGQLPDVAAAADVQSIGLRPDFVAPGVEIVDVTDELVKLWSPDAKTLKIIAQLKTIAPLPIEQIAKMGPND